MLGDVGVAIGGEGGAHSEIVLALKVGRPVATLESWDFGGHVAAVAASEAVEAAFGTLPMLAERSAVRCGYPLFDLVTV